LPPLNPLLLLGGLAPALGPLIQPPAAIAQLPRGHAIRRSAWPVALPPTATVRLKQGGSLSGRLVGFSGSQLILSAASQSEAVPLGQVSMVEFAQLQDLWVNLPNGGRQQVRPIRGMSLPIPGVPRSAVKVNGATDTAIVDLTTVLSEEQFAKLTRHPSVVFVLKQIELTADDHLLLRARTYGVE